MNWETTKTWLIAVFLVLDLVLGWQFLESHQESQSYTESRADIIANTKTLLAQQNFTLKAAIPDEQPSLASIQAAPSNTPLKSLGQAAFPNSKAVTVNEHLGTAAASAGKLQLNQKGTWTVTFRAPQKADTTQDALNLIWKGSLYQLDSSLTDGQKTWIFEQTYQGLPMFNASLVVDRSNKGIEDYQQSLYGTPKPVGSPKPIISALDALNSLANTVDKSAERQDNVIEDIDLGYALKSPGSAATSAISTNYWFPVWRIVTINNTYYVNAFTGEIETQ